VRRDDGIFFPRNQAPGLQLLQLLRQNAVADRRTGAAQFREAQIVVARQRPDDARLPFYIYGFLGGPVPIALQTSLFMTKNLTMKRFSNFESATVKDSQKLGAALADLRERIGDELFRTRTGREFRFDEIDAAMKFETAPGAKAALVA
jgi:hypothetical protein